MSLPERIGKYEIQSVLGRGSTGIVYKGFDSGIKRPVALKVITKSEIPSDELAPMLERFRTEAEAVGRLTHPRIAAIYDFIETDDFAAIVMELVQGKPLEDHLREVTQYGFKDAWEIVRQILDGMGHAHAQGVIHRDLKPANVLINSDGRIKITDFGIAHIDSSKVTQMGDVLGTPHYMSPEQFSGGDPTALTDLYQVGVITYELITGQRPFTGTTSAEVLRRVQNERPANPSAHNTRITWQLDWAIQKALSKDPRDRFASAREMADALRKGLEESLGGPLMSAAQAAAAAAGPVAANLLDKARLIAGAKDAGVISGPDASISSTFAAAGDSKKARVLFVDDEERILNALRTLFRNQYHVFTAENGALALEFVKRFGIHVVVSDQRMPSMTGVELLRQVKDVAPNTVRMLLTGYSDLAAIVGSINDGEVFRFVKKPWDNAEIQKTVADAVAIAMELATAAQSPTAPAARFETPVLVVDPSPELAEGLRQLLGDTAPIRTATSAVEAVQALEAEEIAVIVADLAAGREGLITLFKLLKAQHPEVLSLVVTDDTDSELVIELINQAQVFRFLAKPINTHHLRGYVDMALRRYAQFKKAPDLVRQHVVDESVQAKTSLWGARLFDRIRALPDRLFEKAS